MILNVQMDFRGFKHKDSENGTVTKVPVLEPKPIKYLEPELLFKQNWNRNRNRSLKNHFYVQIFAGKPEMNRFQNRKF